MTRLLRVAAVAVLVGGATAVLTSCSGDPGPIVTETPSPAPTVVTTSPSSPTPSVTPEEELLAQIPENARGEDFQSASNFAKFFLHEYDAMFQKKDETLFRFMSNDDCEFCTSSLSSYASLIDGGGRREGGVIDTSDELAQGGLGEDGSWYLIVPLTVSANQDYDADGEQVDMEPGGTGDIALQLGRVDDRWIVIGADVSLKTGA